MILNSEIKNAINSKLDQGKFQSMCNQILYEMGYKNYSPLGTSDYSDNTVLGTPDTFYIKDDICTFVEFTIQKQKLFKKINDDTDKCIENFSKVSKIKNKKIIIFYSSSRLKPEQVITLENKCKANNISLEIYNIENIANMLINDYPIVAYKYLDIAVDTLQVLNPVEYLDEYNSKKSSVKINERLLFRDKEKNEILDKIKKNDIVLVSGKSGCGKTHLILDIIINKYDYLNEYEILCISNKNQSLFGDLKIRLRKGRKYLLFLDDINNISDFNQIFYFLTLNNYELKIVASVREYAKRNVIDRIDKFEEETRNTFDLDFVTIKKLEEKELIEVIKSNTVIKNPKLINNIIHVSQGNTRIMMMAANVVINGDEDTNTIKDIYNKYYDFSVKELLQQSSTIMKTLAIISIINAIDLSNSGHLKLLDLYNIKIDDFKNDLLILHNNEIVDIVDEDLARVSEQCIANYSVYLSIIENKDIEMQDLIALFFEVSLSKVIDTISMLISVFGDESILDIVKNSVKKLWDCIDKYSISKDVYLEKFGLIIPNETLNYCREYVTNLNFNYHEFKYSTIVVDKNKQYTDNKLFTLLRGFKNTDNFDDSISIIIDYINKDSTVLPDAYKFFAFSCGFDSNILDDNYNIQKKVIEKLISEYSTSKSKNILYLILHLIKEYMKISGDFSYPDKKRNIVIQYFMLHETENLRTFRNMMFDFLLDISLKEDYKNDICDVLFELYKSGSTHKEFGRFVIENDRKKIVQILSLFKPTSFKLCVLMDELNSFYKSFNVEKISFDRNDKCFKFYKNLLKNVDRDIYDNKTLENMKKIVDDYSCGDLDTIFNYFSIIANEDFIKDRWSTDRGICCLIYAFLDKKVEYTSKILGNILKSNISDVFSPQCIIDKCIRNIGYYETKHIILNNYSENNFYYMMYCYLLIPNNYITKKEITKFKRFLLTKVNPKRQIMVDVNLLAKYKTIDNNIFPHYFEIINNIYFDNLSMVSSLTSRIFLGNNEDKSFSLNENFKNNYNVLFKTYMLLLRNRDNYDYNSKIFKMFLKIDFNKYSRVFIKELNNNKIKNLDYNPLSSLWEYDYNLVDKLLNYVFKRYFLRPFWFINFMSIFTKSMKAKRYILSHDMKKTLKYVFPNSKKFYMKEEKILINLIKKYHNNQKAIILLFDIISNRSVECRLECIDTFVSLNSNINIFKKISLEPNSWSWSGSEVPMLEERKSFFINLKEKLNKSNKEISEHNNHIDNYILSLDKRKAKVIREEFVSDWY